MVTRSRTAGAWHEPHHHHRRARPQSQWWPSLFGPRPSYAAFRAMPLCWRQLLPRGRILVAGSRDNAVRGVGNPRLPTWRHLVCGDQARESVLIGRSGENVAVLAIDLHGHDDADHRLLDDRAHEQAGYLRLAGCESPLHGFRSSRLWQGPAERHPGVNELLHIAIDEHDVAAFAQD